MASDLRSAPNGNACTNGQRNARVTMQNGIFLNIAALADYDRGIVRTDDNAEPDAGVLRQSHVTDDIGRRSHPSGAICGQCGAYPVIFIQSHQLSCLTRAR